MTLSSRYRDIPLMKQRLFKGARSHIWNRVYVGVLTGLWIQTWKWGVVEGWWQEMRKRSFHLVINWNSSRISCGNENIFFISKLVLSCTCIIYVALRPRVRWTSAEGENTSPRFVWSTNARYIIASALGKKCFMGRHLLQRCTLIPSQATPVWTAALHGPQRRK